MLKTHNNNNHKSDSSMISKPSIAALGLGLALFSSTTLADISANISLASDYRFRGISQTGEELAVQGGFDWFHNSGFYAGSWASNVDFFPAGSPLDDGASIELDLWAGYTGSASDILSWDATLYYYQYPGDDIDQDFAELGLGLNYGPLRIAYWYADDYLGLDLNNQYLEANYSYELPQQFGLELHLGSSFGEVYDDPATLGLEEYIDYSISLTRNIAGLDMKLSWMDTDIGNGFSVNSGHLANQDALVFSVRKTF